MGDIRNELLSHRHDFSDTRFSVLFDNLLVMGLEEAMDNSELPVDLSDNVRKFVWNFINQKDTAFFHRLTKGRTEFALADLFQKVLKPTPNSATVITTNYDRVAEYAADIVGATAITGFEGSLIRKVELPKSKTRNARIRARERTVQIWKVHGSLDWFEDSTGGVVSFPMTPGIPTGYKPLIIPPGKDKYSSTHNEPYRSVIYQADDAFSQAGSFICIGYGFNDEHIQPKLIEQIHAGKPIVVLCYEATDACRQKVVSSDVKKYAVLEHRDGGKTAVTCSSGGGKTEEYDADFWGLPKFMKTVWG
jgi:hypothetical protein